MVYRRYILKLLIKGIKKGPKKYKKIDIRFIYSRFHLNIFLIIFLWYFRVIRKTTRTKSEN